MQGKTVYDEDGFTVLVPRSTAKSNHGIGQFSLVSEAERDRYDPDAVPETRRTFQCDSKVGYSVAQPNKSWQNKAWRLISTDLNLRSHAPFKNRCDVSTRLRHVIRIGVAMKARGTDPKVTERYKHRPVVQLAPSNNPYGIYMVGSDQESIIELINRIYSMVYSHADSVKKMLRSSGYMNGDYVMKALIIYDDKTYDTIATSPAALFKHLGLRFDAEGRVLL